MAKRFREEDLKPIALTGKYAGEEIKANKIDHKDCKAWMLCCPECYQFVHLRKSDKIKSYFAHYDVEDKNCKYRVESSSNNAEVNRNNNGNQGQDLADIQKDLEEIILNYIANNFEIHNPKIIDEPTVQDCIEYYRLIVNDENNLQEKIEENSSVIFYVKHSYNIVKVVCKILSIDMNVCILDKLIRYAIEINNSSSSNENTINLIIKIIAGIDWTRDKIQPGIIRNNEALEESPLIDYEENTIVCNNANIMLPQVNELTLIDVTSLLLKESIYPFNVSAKKIKVDEKMSLAEKYPFTLETYNGCVYQVTKDGAKIATIELSNLTGLEITAGTSRAAKKMLPLLKIFFMDESRQLYTSLINQLVKRKNNQWFFLLLGLKAKTLVQGNVESINLIDAADLRVIIGKQWIDLTVKLIGDIPWGDFDKDQLPGIVQRFETQLRKYADIELGRIMGVHMPTFEKAVGHKLKRIVSNQVNA